MARYILSIDQGTSGTKSIVFDEKASPVASATTPLHTEYTADGHAEQEPEAIYRSVIESISVCLQKLESEVGVSRDLVECAGIANQRETFLAWDEDGTPMYDAVVWQCKRSVEICAELKASGAEDEIRTRCGLIIDPYFSGSKITWLVRNIPAVRVAHDSGKLRFGTVDSWLLYRLTGGTVYATDHTNASRTLLFNIHTLDWDEELARIFEVPSLRMPTVHPSATHFADSDFDGLFRREIPIKAMIGDSHAALFGERCYTPGSAKATIGTGSSILINAGSSPPKLSPSAMSTIGFSLPDRVDYALEGIIVSAGSLLNWLGKELGFFETGKELDLVAATVPDTGGICVIPGHAGLGAPFWRMDVKGSLTGLTFGTKKAHIMRAALDSIPYQIRAILDAIAEESGVRCQSINADGGISRSTLVMQWLADTLSLPVHTFATSDVTALGAALLAGLGAGIFAQLPSIEKLDIDDSVYSPGSRSSAAHDGYNLWRATVEREIRRVD
jgi:glycerol kinase